MEFLSDYIGGDISDEEMEDVFVVESKVGAAEKDYKTMEDYINTKLKMGASENEDVISEVFDFTEDTEIETIEGAFEEDGDRADVLKAEIESLVNKLE